MASLKGRVALVTGAASGIGSAIARCLAAEGAVVYAADIDSPGNDVSGLTYQLQLDVRSETAWRSALDGIIERRDTLDVLVNCAGIQITRRLEDLELAEWRDIFAVNAEGAFLGTKLAIGAMKSRRGGSIVNISSTYAMVADGLNSAYCASKAAVRLFTKAAALYCADNRYPIRVNSVHPGVIMTPMLEREMRDVAAVRGERNIEAVRSEWEAISPLGVGQPEDIAQAVLYLVSDGARFVT